MVRSVTLHQGERAMVRRQAEIVRQHSSTLFSPFADGDATLKEKQA
jgi:hypothetical protein